MTQSMAPVIDEFSDEKSQNDRSDMNGYTEQSHGFEPGEDEVFPAQ